MTEFDEMKTVQRIADLYRDRGREVTPNQVRARAMRFAKSRAIEIDAAYKAIEDNLLSRNQNSESWDEDR